MRRRTFLAVAAGGALGQAPAQTAGRAKLTSRTVRELRRVSQERRDRLAANPEKTAPAELNRLIPEIDDIEVLNTSSNAKPGKTLRVIAWNTERGRYWREGVQLINETPALRDPDLILLGEMDLGMARSGNVHTTREMAAALKMNYAYGVEFLEFTGGEPQEREQYPGANEWGYHGNAILSRFPLRDVKMLRFPGIAKWYGDYQKRLGGRMALLAKVPGMTVVATHLESAREDSAARKAETDLLLEEVRRYAGRSPILLGGDLNAVPEEPMFDAVRKFGFEVEGSNDLAGGTMQHVVDGKFQMEKYHIDYVLVKDLRVVHDDTSPKIVPAAYPAGDTGKLLADHAIVTAKIELP
jgi:endonuclease/exonuclease/phosphatase family metal-dependent hydrolase